MLTGNKRRVGTQNCVVLKTDARYWLACVFKDLTEISVLVSNYNKKTLYAPNGNDMDSVK